MKSSRLSAVVIGLALILFAAFVFPAPIFGKPPRPQADEAGDKTLSPYFFVKSKDASVDRLPLKDMSASVSISGTIADVTVTQVYKNEGKNPLEALYVFPASTKAAVHGMKMTIGSRVIEARVAKREDARREYEQARDSGHSASLLEQQRPNVFQMSVANITPGDEIKVELRYTELLVPTDGVYEFVYPTVVGPRYSNRPDTPGASDDWVKNPYLHQKEAPPYTFDIKASVAAGTPISELACASHKVSVHYEGPSLARIDLDKSQDNGGNRDYILRYRLAGGRIESGLLLYEGEKENFFLLNVQPPKKVALAQVLPREYVFVVDVSGSMWGYPLDISKQLVKDLLGGLRSTDLFNVVLFSGGSSVMAEQSVPATAQNIRKAADLIDRQRGGGGTELLPAMKEALGFKRHEGYSRTIVVATDGFVEVEEEVFDLVRKNLGKANVFAFGIGTSVNRHIIEGMAAAGMGEPFVITKPEDAPLQAARFRAMIESPVLTGIKIDFKGFDAYDIEPPHVPDVLAERPVVVFGKYRGKLAGTITLSGIAGDGAYKQVIDVSKAKPAAERSGLRYLWARHRITLLSDYNKLRADAGRTATVTDLGLRYNLLTPYTSFVAVDTQTRSKDGKPVSVKQPLPLPEGVSDYAVGAGGPAYPALAYAPAPGGAMDQSLNMGGWSGPRYRALKAKAGHTQAKADAGTGGGAANAGARLAVSDVAISGALVKEAVSKILNEQAAGFEKYLLDAANASKLTVRLTIGPDGAVTAAKALKGAFAWQKDVLEAMKKWTFPPTGDAKAAVVTFTMTAGG